MSWKSLFHELILPRSKDYQKASIRWFFGENATLNKSRSESLPPGFFEIETSSHKLSVNAKCLWALFVFAIFMTNKIWSWRHVLLAIKVSAFPGFNTFRISLLNSSLNILWTTHNFVWNQNVVHKVISKIIKSTSKISFSWMTGLYLKTQKESKQ